MADGIDLGKKAGPLPLGAWVAVVGGGLAIAYYFNKKNAAKATSVQTTESGVGLGGQFATVAPDTSTSTGTTDTNEDWRKRVTNYLVGLGYPATVADAAVRKYITGQALNIQEQAMINEALIKFGVPPEPISGPPNTGPAAVTGLVGHANGPNSVSLNWLPSLSANGYTVLVSSQFGQTSYPAISPPFTSLDTAPDTTATWTVIATNDFGQSEPTSIQVTTPPYPAGAPAPTQPQPQAPAPNSAPPPPPVARTYTIAGGDTLWGISAKVYGNAAQWQRIYNANAGAIDGAARAHGKTSSRGGPVNQVGWWVFPGTVLTIP